MRLTGASFDALESALRDAFADYDELGRVTRCFNTQLQDITAEDRMPIVIQKLIEYCESRDQIPDLVQCAKERNTTNRLLQALALENLEEEPTTEEVVDAGGGAATFKDRLKSALADLDTAGLQIVAAHDLESLLDGASPQEANTLYLALLGNVKIDRSDEVVAALVPVVATSLRTLIGDDKRPDTLSVDLARARLRRIDLSALDLHEADIAFADLRQANLDGANLWRSRGYAVDVTQGGLSRSNLEEARWHAALARETRFHDCRMISVFLKDADLTGAEFQQSKLQGAHFERANLEGARFEEANLADARFTEATIDDAAAQSIARAKNWKTAHFDEETRKRIEKLA